MKGYPVKLKSLGFILLLAFGAAACGADSDPTPQAPTPTPEPTLTFEERVEFPAGQAQNPLLLALRPDSVVSDRLLAAIATAFEVRPSRVTMDYDIADALGDPDQLARLNQALESDFQLAVNEDDIDSLETVRDLSEYVHSEMAAHVSGIVFENTGLFIDIVFVDQFADALGALCDSGSGLVTVPWLDGMTYYAAVSQGCGQPALVGAREPGAPDRFLDFDMIFVGRADRRGDA